MATTYTLKSSDYNGRYMYVSLTQTKNIAKNTSTINWTLTVTGGTSNYYTTGPTTLTINGTQAYYCAQTAWNTYDFPAAKGSVSGTLEVAHDSNGAKSIEVSLSTAIYVSTVSTYKGTWTLDNNPRQATLLTAPNFTDEENPKITYSNPAGAAVTSVEACISFDGSSANIPYRAIEATGSSYTFTLTADEKAQLYAHAGTKTTATVYFYIKTVVSGNTFYSSSGAKTFTIVNSAPTLAPTAVDTLAAAVALTGSNAKIIAGYNTVSFNANATAKKGATIKSYSITCDGKSATTATGTFSNVSKGVITFTVTDSRGQSATATKTLTVVNYIPLTCHLSVESGLTGTTTAKMTLNISGNCFTGSFGAKTNTITIKYRYKNSGGSYGSWTTTTATASSGTYTASATISGLNYQNSIVCQAIAYDLIKTGGVSSAEVTGKALPVFDWSGTDFNFNVPVSIGGVVIDYIVEQGTKDGWEYRKWNSGKAECWKTLTHSTAINNAWGALYCGTYTARQNYPFGFTDKPKETATLGCGGSAAMLMVESSGLGVNGAYASACYNVARPTAVASAQTFYITLYVCGKWK